MGKESFFEILITRYRDDVEKILEDFHFKSYELDISNLNMRLESLPMDQVFELNKEDWLDLIFDIRPEVYSKLKLTRHSAA